MRVVIDANIAAAALIRPDGWTAHQLERDDVTFLAPGFLFNELHDHAESYAGKADVEPERFRERIARFERRVEPVTSQALLEAADDPLVQKAETIDPDDAPYLAALVAADADLLWTRDQALLDAFEGLTVRVLPEGA